MSQSTAYQHTGRWLFLRVRHPTTRELIVPADVSSIDWKTVDRGEVSVAAFGTWTPADTVFDVLQDRPDRTEDAWANVVGWLPSAAFPDRGAHQIELRITMTDGAVAAHVQPVDVLPAAGG